MITGFRIKSGIILVFSYTRRRDFVEKGNILPRSTGLFRNFNDLPLAPEVLSNKRLCSTESADNWSATWTC
jgi:hypothetical protein